MKKFLFYLALFSVIFVSTPNDNVLAEVNSTPYDQMQRDWGRFVFENYRVNTYPDLYRPFSSATEAYNNIKPTAYNTENQIQDNYGFYPSGQSVSIKGTPTETSETVTVYESETLTNNTDSEQKLLSNALQYTVSNATTITTTNSFDLGISTQTSFNVFFAKAKVTASAQYNFAHSDAQTTSTSIQYIIPSQSITVPAGHTVEVSVEMDLGQVTGELNINGQLTGTSPTFMLYDKGSSSYNPHGFEELGTFYVNTNGQYNPCNFSYLSPTTVSYIGGSAEFTSNYHTNTSLVVKDLTDQTTSKYLVENAIVN